MSLGIEDGFEIVKILVENYRAQIPCRDRKHHKVHREGDAEANEKAIK